ncbi:MAG TPA: hypothetical protein VHG51_18000 [Longimicrobiaceae bacterium]|nr:hypothetical protein [Longimicrobiaceae bacterium]
MARHNREGRGEDQRGNEFRIGYQPDWFRLIKVTRDLATGRQSTKTLFRNPEAPLQDPGSRVRTRVQAPELGLDVEVSLHDARQVVRRITIETVVPEGPEQGETVVLSITRASADAAPDED